MKKVSFNQFSPGGALAATEPHDLQFSLKAYSDSAFTIEVSDDNQVTLGKFSTYHRLSGTYKTDM